MHNINMTLNTDLHPLHIYKNDDRNIKFLNFVEYFTG